MRASRNRHGIRGGEKGPVQYSLRAEKGASNPKKKEATEVALADLGPAAIVQDSLPQPEEDQAIGGEVSRLRTLIKHHVQSYYHTAPLEPSLMGSAKANQASLVNFSQGQPPRSDLTSLLLNPKTRFIAIRFCIAWTIISRIEFTCHSDISFLPPEIADCMSSMSGAESGNKSESFIL